MVWLSSPLMLGERDLKRNPMSLFDGADKIVCLISEAVR